ncbi:MAG TPA: MFS transporter [Candidatus Eremiobacteraeota bacterium]|nr:MAG: enterobactin exporter EntS [bacterium ADurb.Bin363]HPZ08669.1 MFS transporter [Candidatus Eremiobacteraeota bacterium]
MYKILLNRNFVLLLTGMTISRLGSGIDFIGLNLYVHHVFGSGKILGTFMMAKMLPAIFFGPLGGYLADHYSRKKIMIICDTLRALLILGYIFTKDLTTFFIIGIITSALDKIYTASSNAILPNIVEKEDLMKANSIMRMASSPTTVIASMAGAVIVSFLNFQWIFIIDSLSFVISTICVTLIIIITQTEKKGSTKEGILEEFRGTIEFLKTQPIMIFLVIVKTIDALGSGAYNMGLPLFAKTLAMSRGAAYGWLVGIWSAGVFFGSLMTDYISKRFKISTETFFGISILIMALGMGLTFHFNSLYPAMISIFLGGIGDGLSNVLFFTVLMKDTPDKMRGKILGTASSMVISTVAFGMGLSGFFIDKYPIRVTTDFATYMILLSVFIGIIYFSFKSKKELERT